eukprot:4639617-Alexandrium_andersonii.AAC.1
MSGVFCSGCLSRGLGRLLPPDLALEEEEAGALCAFLGARIRALGQSAHITMAPCNLAFALGRS